MERKILDYIGMKLCSVMHVLCLCVASQSLRACMRACVCACACAQMPQIIWD